MRKFENRFINIIQKDTRERLLLFMMELLEEQRGARPVICDTIVIPNYLTQEEISRLIGSSRQTVTTLLSKLKDEGIIDYSGKAIKYHQVSRYFSGKVN
jgi:CRP/FNR family transcriptional regulator